MNLLGETVDDLAARLCEALAAMPEEERIDALNGVRSALHGVSPMRDQPVDLVLWVRSGEVTANDYNPNAVAAPEMRLLERSIEADGYTQPVVTALVADAREVVDGFHRSRVGKERPRVRERVRGRLPVVTVRGSQAGEAARIAATIRHNRARGVHGVVPMSEVVARLLRAGLRDDEVARELGMDADEVLRFKQTRGIAGAYAGRDYSRAWE